MVTKSQQMDLKTFLDLVAKQPKGGTQFQSTNWDALLDKKVAGWQTVVLDSANWVALAENTNPKKDREELMMTMVNFVGLKLAEEFIMSKNSAAQYGAKRWFRDNLALYSTFSNVGKNSIDADDVISNPSQVWQHLDPKKRVELIDFAWAKAYKLWTAQMIGAFSLHLNGASRAEISLFMGQPSCEHELDHIFFVLCNSQVLYTRSFFSSTVALSRPFWLPRLRPETLNPLKALQACMKSTPADHVALAHYEHIRQQFLDMTSSVPLVLMPYDLTSTIPEVIKTWFKEKQELLAPGYKLPEFPTVEISHDDPPAFKEHPALKMLYEEDRDDIELDSTDIERLLGVYIWKDKHIIIWRKGVDLCSRTNQLRHQDLFNCVLVHELGHWFNAEATVANGVAWDLSPITLTVTKTNEPPAHPNINTPNDLLPTVIKGDARSLSSRCYHEAWAQLFAWLYGQEKDAGVLAAFEALEKGQFTPYHAWRQLVNANCDPYPYKLKNLLWNQDCILKSLEGSRSLKKDGGPTPATFADINFPQTNMITWLNKHCKTVQPAASTD